MQRAADARWLLIENATSAPRPIAQSPSAVAAALSARVERMEPLLLAAATEGVRFLGLASGFAPVNAFSGVWGGVSDCQ